MPAEPWTKARGAKSGPEIAPGDWLLPFLPIHLDRDQLEFHWRLDIEQLRHTALHRQYTQVLLLCLERDAPRESALCRRVTQPPSGSVRDPEKLDRPSRISNFELCHSAERHPFRFHPPSLEFDHLTWRVDRLY